MASLLLNFIKRAIIIPIAVTVIVIGVIYSAVPRFISEGQTRTSSLNDRIDLSLYNVKEYNSFKELNAGDYIGDLRCENIDLGSTAVVYKTESDNAVYASGVSKEPWSGGSMLIIGSDNSSQFGKFYNSKKGDKISLEFYSKETYKYKIEKKVVGVTDSELNGYVKDGKLIIAVPYNDFSNLGSSFFYTLYIAGRA